MRLDSSSSSETISYAGLASVLIFRTEKNELNEGLSFFAKIKIFAQHAPGTWMSALVKGRGESRYSCSKMDFMPLLKPS